MNELKKKKPTTTLSKRNGFKTLKYTVKTLEYVAPFIPVATIVGINFEEWFIENQDGFKVAGGFIMLIISTLLTYLAIAKKKNLLKDFSAFWSVAIILLCWGLSILLLTSIFAELGNMLLYIGFGVIASACLDETEIHYIEKKYAFYQDLVIKNGLDKKVERKRIKEELAKKQAEEEAKRERKVDYL